MIFEIIRGGEKTDWVGKKWAGLFFPRGKNWLGGNSGLLHRNNFSKKVDFEKKIGRQQKSMQNVRVCKELRTKFTYMYNVVHS